LGKKVKTFFLRCEKKYWLKPCGQLIILSPRLPFQSRRKDYFVRRGRYFPGRSLYSHGRNGYFAGRSLYSHGRNGYFAGRNHSSADGSIIFMDAAITRMDGTATLPDATIPTMDGVSTLPDATIPRRTEALLSWTQPLLACQEESERFCPFVITRLQAASSSRIPSRLLQRIGWARSELIGS